MIYKYYIVPQRVIATEADGFDMDNIVVSTRVRLARNIAGFPFNSAMTVQKRKALRDKVAASFTGCNSPVVNEFLVIQMEDISDTDAIRLLEKHLISPEFLRDRGGKALLLRRDETVSIMINEEDHLRIQVFSDGYKPDETLDLAQKIDTLLSEGLNYQKDDKYGFITQCETNLGSGLRMSFLMRLPALSESGGMGEIAYNLNLRGITVRGMYGEGTRAAGAHYQISGKSSLDLLKRQVCEIAGYEQRFREAVTGIAI